MKLRAYRKYSIKLMLAWGTCCRFPLLLILVIKMADNRIYIYVEQRSDPAFSSPTQKFPRLPEYKAW